MKNILLLTDLSESETSLYASGVLLAARLGCDLQLLNVYSAVPYVPALDAGSYQGQWYSELYDDHMLAFKARAEDIQEMVRSLSGSRRRPEVRSAVMEGEIGGQVEEFLANGETEMILMGAGKSSAFSHMLFGAAISSVVRSANVPVLIIPQHSPSIKWDGKVVFATDFHENDLRACRYLSNLGRLLGFSTEVVHVKNERGIHPKEIDRENRFVDQLKLMKLDKLSYRHLMGGNVFGLLEQWSGILEAEYLSLSEHHRPFVASLFKKNTIKAAIAHQKMPLLIFPENFPARGETA